MKVLAQFWNTLGITFSNGIPLSFLFPSCCGLGAIWCKVIWWTGHFKLLQSVTDLGCIPTVHSVLRRYRIGSCTTTGKQISEDEWMEDCPPLASSHHEKTLVSSVIREAEHAWEAKLNAQRAKRYPLLFNPGKPRPTIRVN